MQPVRISAFEERDADGYRAFARAQFGENAYQASMRYLDWLYAQNPCARGKQDFLLARAKDGRIVGCVHKLILPWRVGSETRVLPTLHNLMVEPEHQKGAGVFLWMAALRGEENAIIPAAVGNLSKASRRLRYQPVPSWWFRSVLTPVRAGLRWGLRRSGAARAGGWLSRDLDVACEGCRIATQPRPEALARITHQLNGDGDECQVAWTDALIQWRLFSEAGPRHALIESDDGEAFAILSLGPRHGLQVSRLIAWSFGNDAGSTSALHRRLVRGRRADGADGARSGPRSTRPRRLDAHA